MDIAAFLQEICAMPGHSGMESAVACRVAEEFASINWEMCAL